MVNKYGQHVTRYLEDPQNMNQFTQRAFGQDAKSFETQLAALADVRAGRMPEGATFKQLAAQTRQFYGWSEKQTKQSLQQIIDLPLPQARIGAFLHTGGRQVTRETLNMADRLAQDYDRTRSEVGLEMKSLERDRLEANDPFSKKHIPEFKNGEAEKRDAQILRNTLEFFSGTNKPQTFEEKRAAVVKARLEVADRLEAHAMKENASLRDELARNLEAHQVNELSKEYGLGDPMSDAREIEHARSGHMSESYDPIESTGLMDDQQ